MQDLEIEIIPRLEKRVCRLNEPDSDDVNLSQAPVRGLPPLQTASSFPLLARQVNSAA